MRTAITVTLLAAGLVVAVGGAYRIDHPSLDEARRRPPRGKWISIVAMGNGQGEIEPCG